MKFSVSCFAVSMVVATAAIGQTGQPTEFDAPPQGSLMPEQLSAIALAIRNLEANPAAPNAAHVRSELVRWLIESPDISVAICGFPATKLMESSCTYHSELFGQFLLGMAAFKIEVPAEANDHEKTVVAGMKSAISLYKSYRDLYGSSAKDKFMDKLVEEQSRDKLEAYLSERIDDC